MLCALEPSADALGASLMQALKRQRPDTKFVGCGGDLMALEGLVSQFSIRPFSVVGLGGAIAAIPAALKAIDKLEQAAKTTKPDAAIFIDGWGFSKLAAKRFQKKVPWVKRIKYVAPQVWASRPSRAEQVAQLFDGVICLFDFETPYYSKFPVDVRAVGHSGFQRALEKPGDGNAFRAQHRLHGKKLLAVLPGSRAAELRRLNRPFLETLNLIVARIPNLNIVVAAAPAVEQQIAELVRDWPIKPIIVGSDQRFNAFAAADAAFAASGTVTTELAIHQTPMIMAYRVDLITNLWARLVMTAPFTTLINIVAGRQVIPEFIQEHCNPEKMADALYPLLTESPERTAQLAAFPELVAALAGTGQSAADDAAEAILSWAIGKN